MLNRFGNKMIKKLRYLKYYSKVLLNNWTQNKDSYAQHGEDKIVELLLPEGINTFIDIGANDGVLFSNTYKFAKKGAQGLCIEPSPSAYKKLKLNHLIHPRIKCFQCAVSNEIGHIFLKEDGYEETLSKVYTECVPGSFKVPTITFDHILKKYPYFINTDLLSIDVEGHEKNVLDGLRNHNFNAKLIIIESDKSGQLEILEDNYIPYLTNGVNLIYVNKLLKLKDVITSQK
jgi:FkbM family methyltransferase